MFRVIPLFLSILICLSCTVVENSSQYPELELKGVSQLDSSYTTRFDLSGMVAVKNNIYVIADKLDNRFIYEIEFDRTSWSIKEQLPVALEESVDFEAMDACNSCFYITNEFDNQAYKIDKKGKVEKVPVDYTAAGINEKEWKLNTGLESLALDCKNKVLYLAKEREPRYIMKIDLVTGKVLDQFNIAETESNDFADMKFENGYLYMLERNGNYIAKVDPATHAVVAKVSYRATCSAPEGKLYEPSEFGMAEALLLTKDEIWLGLDNNELEVSPSAASKYKMKGIQPIILKFKRPKGF
jgi:uncharacterized protein YjiK